VIVDAILIVFAVTVWRLLASRERTRLRMRSEYRRRRTDQKMMADVV
jgi:uncharacterized membrane protein